jgi:hypothetical protein
VTKGGGGGGVRGPDASAGSAGGGAGGRGRGVHECVQEWEHAAASDGEVKLVGGGVSGRMSR